MAKNRFIKFMPCEEAGYLLEHHPNAFLLLSLIAMRARRVPDKPDGLEIAEAFIGDYRKAGIESEKKYRTAKSILQLRGHLLICETCRNRKKGATGLSTIGTKVKLLKSTIWDINSEVDGDRKGDRRATEGRPKGDEEERNKNVKKKEKVKKENPPSLFFHKRVKMESTKYDQLVQDFGLEKISQILEKLDVYADINPKRFKQYACHAAVIRKWIKDDMEKLVSNASTTRIWSKFKNGEVYDGYEFYFSGDKMSFVRSTGTSHKEFSLRVNDPNLDKNFQDLMNSLNIKIPPN